MPLSFLATEHMQKLWGGPPAGRRPRRPVTTIKGLIPQSEKRAPRWHSYFVTDPKASYSPEPPRYRQTDSPPPSHSSREVYLNDAVKSRFPPRNKLAPETNRRRCPAGS